MAAKTSFKVKVDPRTESMPDEALDCREAGHKWDPHAPFQPQRGEHGRMELRRERECKTCGTTRVHVYAYPSFELVKQRYHHAEGYLTTMGEGEERLRKSDIRAAQFARQQQVVT